MSDTPLNIVKFDKAPCYRCGYNGANYYQPETHPCAAEYHRIQELMEELRDPLIAAEKYSQLEREVAAAKHNEEVFHALHLDSEKQMEALREETIEECARQVKLSRGVIEAEERIRALKGKP